MWRLPPYIPVFYAGKILLEVARRTSDYHETTGLSPGDQSGFPLDCSITHMMVVVGRL